MCVAHSSDTETLSVQVPDRETEKGKTMSFAARVLLLAVISLSLAACGVVGSS
jgi:hypothetical protein